MQETWVQSMGCEDPLENEQLLTLVFWPGKSHEQRSLMGYRPWGCKESGTTEQLSLSCEILYYYIHMCVLSCDQLFATLWSVAHQAPLYVSLFLARILEWVAISSSRESFWPRYWTHFSCISCIGRRFFLPLSHLEIPTIIYTPSKYTTIPVPTV